ncbi:hypothetical protein [Deinococcus sp.]|uniref:hypothetical protein n=1 Tax=Deinococcus sp. TaxID=47478 RepID=UPI0025C65A92|nr:hypothetical protein [Deinococcus sp.]
MPRFDYLDEPKKKKIAKKGKSPKNDPEPDGRIHGQTAERVEAVYVRKETIRAAWREYRHDGGESVSELVEDLLLRWLRERG